MKKLRKEKNPWQKGLDVKTWKYSSYQILITIGLFAVTHYTHFKGSQFKRRSLILNSLLSFQWHLAKTEE